MHNLFRLSLVLFMLLLCIASVSGQYQVGVGIADITGPVTFTFMGYADWTQVGQGILQRVYARAFIVRDLESHKRMVFVNTDTQSMSDIVKKRVVQRLAEKYGDVYTTENVMLSSTHSHSGVGGYLQYTLFAFSVKGWIEETTEPIVQGIVDSIVQAHESLQDGYVTFNEGELLNANINRSPRAYLLNPEEERRQYKYDVDKTMTLLGLHDIHGRELGFINWFAVHGVSVNNTNHLVNGDNKGYAAYAAEKRMNRDSLPGKGPFVAGFAQANEGDVSPNTEGAFCGETDIPCDGSLDTKCPGSLRCFGRGPGWKISDYESNKIIGERQANMAIELFRHATQTVQGPIDFRQKYWDITKETIVAPDGRRITPCLPAVGYAFGAGTTDGPAMKGLYQNMTHETFGWSMLRNMIKRPSKQQRDCHAPKAILLNTGEMTLPYTWQPTIFDVQLIRLGNIYIAGMPAEFTTMSGRRLRRAIKAKLIEYGAGDDDTQVILSGPANGYASYVTTYEEYQMQRFEGGATAYGPHTLQAYINVFEELAAAMATGQPAGPSEVLPDYTSKAFSFARPVRSDGLKPFHRFGQIVRDIDTSVAASKSGTVSARFVAGHPRNNPMIGKTFLTVEKRLEDGTWKIVRTDDDYDTRFKWKYTNTIMAYSEATIEWDIDNDTPAGTYRIGYFGHHREFFSRKVIPHHGYSSEFEIPISTLPQEQRQPSPLLTQCTHQGVTPFQHVFPFYLLH